MNCTNCGSIIDNNANVCPNCGAPVNPAMYGNGQPIVQNQMPYETPEQISLSKSILTFGILALVFCEGFLGIIFGAIGLSKSKQYAAMYGLTGRAKVGSILSRVGMIVGIVMTVVWIILIIVCAVAGASYATSAYYNYY